MIFVHKAGLVLLGIFLGIIWYRSDLQPRPLIRRIYRGDYKKFSEEYLGNKNWDDAQLTFSKYKLGVPLFLDRPYSDSIGDKKLEDLYLIRINRHEKKNIKIQTLSPITIYRIIPEIKNNLRNNYKKTNIKVKVLGKSIDLNHVVKKKFEPGIIILSSGGPISSSPILFSTKLNETITNINIEKTNQIINLL